MGSLGHNTQGTVSQRELHVTHHEVGSCARLPHPADTFDIITAWRRVGIAGNKFQPDFIDRKGFLDQAREITEASHMESDVCSPGPSTLAEAKKTPPGVRSGSLAAMSAKLAQLEEYARKMENK
mgnify:CR=1 FL=1